MSRSSSHPSGPAASAAKHWANSMRVLAPTTTVDTSGSVKAYR